MTGGGGGVWRKGRQGLGDRIVLARDEPQIRSLMYGWRSVVVHQLVKKLDIGHQTHWMNWFGPANQSGNPTRRWQKTLSPAVCGGFPDGLLLCMTAADCGACCSIRGKRPVTSWKEHMEPLSESV